VTRKSPSAKPGTALTEREGEILELLASGLSSSEVADGLKISKTTLSGHLLNIRSRLGVPTTTAAVVSYLRSLTEAQRRDLPLPTRTNQARANRLRRS
jgi:DNA-binding CsgD family transcriptional regulator